MANSFLLPIVVAAISFRGLVDAYPISPVPPSPPDAWVYLAVITSIFVSLAFLMVARSTFSRWRRHSTSTQLRKNSYLTQRAHPIRSPTLIFPKRCILSSTKIRMKSSGILVGFLGSPNWEITGVMKSVESDWRWALPVDKKYPSPAKSPQRSAAIHWAIKTMHYNQSTAPASLNLLDSAVDSLSQAPPLPPVHHTGFHLTSSTTKATSNFQTCVGRCAIRGPFTGHLTSSHNVATTSSQTFSLPGVLERDFSVPQRLQCLSSTPPGPTISKQFDSLQAHPPSPHASASTSTVNRAGRSVRLVQRSSEVESSDSAHATTPGLRIRGVTTSLPLDISSLGLLQVSPQLCPPLQRSSSPLRMTFSPAIGPSPLRSMMLPISSSDEVTPSHSSRKHLAKNPYDHLGLGHPSRSPIESNVTPTISQRSIRSDPPASPHGQASTTTQGSAALEDMIHQLVQATSDWDDSVFVNEDFRSLIETSKSPSSPGTAQSPPSRREATPQLEASSEEAMMPCSSSTGHFYSPYFYSYSEMSRLPLFSIPEEP
ncbi:hypothetical protein CC2G_010505 [Coprinopsis cinerea AmutBmut pab1-1]|nr:hypothetical protein CC2G_010505 [Coprinopsis cinerea AmutBmut pab1-1]